SVVRWVADRRRVDPLRQVTRLEAVVEEDSNGRRGRGRGVRLLRHIERRVASLYLIAVGRAWCHRVVAVGGVRPDRGEQGTVAVDVVADDADVVGRRVPREIDTRLVRTDGGEIRGRGGRRRVGLRRVASQR